MMINMKKQVIILILIFSLLTINLTGCTDNNEDDRWVYVDSFIVIEGDTVNISDTNFSIRIIDCNMGQWVWQAYVTCVVYKDDIAIHALEFDTSSNNRGDNNFRIGDLKVVLVDNNKISANFKIYTLKE